jgi:hypothetical protein
MIDTNQIKPHAQVVGLDDQVIGKVDHIEGQSLKLTKDDTGKHHLIPLDWIDRVDDKIHVNKKADEVQKTWTTTA